MAFRFENKNITNERRLPRCAHLTTLTLASNGSLLFTSRPAKIEGGGSGGVGAAIKSFCHYLLASVSPKLGQRAFMRDMQNTVDLIHYHFDRHIGTTNLY